jgi:hypothetical protein
MDPDSLTEQARQCLEDELRRRGIEAHHNAILQSRLRGVPARSGREVEESKKDVKQSWISHIVSWLPTITRLVYVPVVIGVCYVAYWFLDGVLNVPPRQAQWIAWTAAVILTLVYFGVAVVIVWREKSGED